VGENVDLSATIKSTKRRIGDTEKKMQMPSEDEG